MKTKYFIKIFILLIICCIALVSKGMPHKNIYKGSKATISKKVFRKNDLPENPFFDHTRFEGNQEIARQIHKASNNPHRVSIIAQSFKTYVKCVNFFSEYNDQRSNLLNTVFLFPFHAFW